jgi:hypothetical protein
LRKDENAETVKSKAKHILDKISSRGQDFAQLIHYNNIISGYLTVSEKHPYQGKKRNVQSIFFELKDSYFEKELSELYDKEEKENIEKMKKELAKANITEPQKLTEVESLSIEALNTAVLNYNIEKKDEKPVQGWSDEDRKEIGSF